MPSFRFRGFAEASVVALTVAQGAQAVEASMTWGQQPGGGGSVGGGGQPTASFSIERVDETASGDEVAPFGCWLRATGLSGFAVSEPEGDDNVYDPSQHRVTYVWTLPDEGYAPILAPNLPDAFRTHTVDYGKQIAVVFTTPGVKTVSCFAYDDAGNWAVAEHVFGPGGQSNEIQDPDTFFSGLKTICIRRASNPTDTTGMPAGCMVAADIPQAINFLRTRTDAGDLFCRVMFAYDEVYDNLGTSLTSDRDAARGLYIDAYGTPGARPKFVQRTNNAPFNFRASLNGYCVFANMDLEGPWDAATETGRVVMGTSGTGSGWYKGGNTPLLIYRCKWSGFDTIQLNRETGQGKDRILFDTEVTNWKNFGIFSSEAAWRMAWIWCDIHQHEDALNGCNLSETGNSNNYTFGNTHGCFRGDPLWMHVSRSSFFSRNGWSQANPQDFVSQPPTAGQPCIRYQGLGKPQRAYINFTMSSFEGTGDMLRHQWFTGDADENNTPRNFVYDRNVMCATANTGNFMNMNYAGYTIRNNYFYRPDVVRTAGIPTTIVGLGTSGWSGALVNLAPDRIYNNTVVFAGPSSNIASGSDPDPQPRMSPGQLAERGTLTEENNLVYAPDLTTPVGLLFAPLGSDPLTGFVPRYKGDRWNFPPIGLSAGGTMPVWTVSAARALETGVPGPVPAGEWCAIGYPDYTGKCLGALDAALQSNTIRDLILANGTQKHAVSVTSYDNSKLHGDTALWPDADGLVEIDFAPDRIRIRNLTGQEWGVGGGDERIAMLLDLSDYLMDFKPGTTSPGAIPLPIPGADSGARVAEKIGLWAPSDLLGVERTLPTAVGAFHPAG